MAVKFFGQFLVERGVLHRDELRRAVDFQAANNQLFGEVCVQRGLLTPTQVNSVFAKQKLQDKRFGEIAIGDGLLTVAQVDNVLTYQRNSWLHLGEALVNLDLMARSKLEAELAAFRKDQAGYVTDSLPLAPEVADPALVETALGLTQKLLFRMCRLQAKLGMCDLVGEVRSPLPLALSIRVEGPTSKSRIYLLLDERLADRIANGWSGRPMTLSSANKLDVAREFLNMVAGNTCTRLAQVGLLYEISVPERLGEPMIRAAAGEQLLMATIHTPEEVAMMAFLFAKK